MALARPERPVGRRENSGSFESVNGPSPVNALGGSAPPKLAGRRRVNNCRSIREDKLLSNPPRHRRVFPQRAFKQFDQRQRTLRDAYETTPAIVFVTFVFAGRRLA